MQTYFRKNIPQFFFVCLFLLLSIQSIFNVLCLSFGLNYPYTTFLYNPYERFEDFFKIILSYPHHLNIFQPNISWPDFFRVPDFITRLVENNPYGGIEVLNVPNSLSHFHTPPFYNFFNLMLLELFKFIPAHLIFSTIVIMFYYFTFRVIKLCRINYRDNLFWFLSFALSYPSIHTLSRGNMGAMIAFLCAFYFLIKLPKVQDLGKDRETVKLNLLLFFLAIGVNFRPNLALLVFIPLVNLKYQEIIKLLLSFFFYTALIFFVFLWLSHHFYEAYTLKTFFNGLSRYHFNYIVNNGGIGFGSSFFSVLKAFFGYHIFLEYLNYLIAAIVFLCSFYLKKNNKINLLSFAFIICGLSLMVTPVIGDYHLTLFFAVAIFGYKNKLLNLNDKISKVIIFSIVLLISPKNYFFSGIFSYQIILNPLIFFSSALYILSHQQKLTRKPI
jgi:hypothetical protein